MKMAASALTCTICVDNFEESGDLCSTVCGHVFHFSCLQQWQERSNTCPLCNQRDPRPHRLFLDFPAEAPASKTDNKQGDSSEHLVIIKGIQPQLIVTPLSDVILDLARVMKVPLSQSDIKNVSKKNKNDLHVVFHAVNHKKLFLENKFVLKSNSETSGVDIQELLDIETKKLFQHAHNLKQCGYKIFFVKNKKIYAKKEQKDTPINIISIEQVDLLCTNAEKTNLRGNVPPNIDQRNSNAPNLPTGKQHKSAPNTNRRKTVTSSNSKTSKSSFTHRELNSVYLSAVRSATAPTMPTRQSTSTSTNPVQRFSSPHVQSTPTAPAHHLLNSSPILHPRRNTVLTAHTTSVSTSAAQREMDRESANLIQQILLEDSIDVIPVHRATNHSYTQNLNNVTLSSNRPQPKSFKGIMVSVFKKIKNKFNS